MRISISLFLLAFVQLIVAQNTVTFKVNMNEYTGEYTNVNLNGTFNGWCGECALMTDDNSDGIYEIDVDLPNGQIEYKFTTDGWTVQEEFTPGGPCTLTSGNFTNRVRTIDGDEVLDTVCWEACEDCGAPPSSADVTFRVDMSEFTGTYTTVNLNGTFNGWCGTCAEMTDLDSDGIYEITANVPTDSIEYKFTIDGWEGQEEFDEGTSCTLTTDGFTNRLLIVEGETTLPIVCWNSCVSCNPDGISEFTELDLDIVPNPSTGQVKLNLAAELINKDGQVNIYTITGKIISTLSLSTINDGRIDLSFLNSGLYMVEVRADQYRSIERLTIQK